MGTEQSASDSMANPQIQYPDLNGADEYTPLLINARLANRKRLKFILDL